MTIEVLKGPCAFGQLTDQKVENLSRNYCKVEEKLDKIMEQNTRFMYIMTILALLAGSNLMSETLKIIGVIK